MHEFGIIKSLVEETMRIVGERNVERVVAVRFRRGSAFSEDALRHSFAALTAGTVLENAKVVVETVNLHHRCVCGHEQIITADELIGHLFVCPECTIAHEVEEAHDLELLEIEFDEKDGVGAASAAPAKAAEFQPHERRRVSQ